jgi:hypothetical protein
VKAVSPGLEEDPLNLASQKRASLTVRMENRDGENGVVYPGVIGYTTDTGEYDKGENLRPVLLRSCDVNSSSRKICIEHV